MKDKTWRSGRKISRRRKRKREKRKEEEEVDQILMLLLLLYGGKQWQVSKTALLSHSSCGHILEGISFVWREIFLVPGCTPQETPTS